MDTAVAPRYETTVLHVGGLHYASEKAVVERVLGARPGVAGVEANPVAQTATVTFDPAATSVAQLRVWVEECGLHCAGRSVPGHVCDPLAERGARASVERADQAHGHGHGGHAGMSMEAMERDMRNRFLVALLFTIPIELWSMVGTELLGTELARSRPTEGDRAPRRRARRSAHGGRRRRRSAADPTRLEGAGRRRRRGRSQPGRRIE